MQTLCPCVRRGRLTERLRQIGEEISEWMQAPSRDEASDVAWAIGRLVGHVLGRVYVPIPGDGPHRRKITRRVEEYGCVLSRRHSVEH